MVAFGNHYRHSNAGHWGMSITATQLDWNFVFRRLSNLVFPELDSNVGFLSL